MLDKLISAAKDAYAEAPGPAGPRGDRAPAGRGGRWNQRDDYEKALDLAKFLIDHGSKEKQLREMAGVAAFAVGDFPAAEAYFQEAAAAGTLGRPPKGNSPKSNTSRRRGRRRRSSARRRPRPTTCPGSC